MCLKATVAETAVRLRRAPRKAGIIAVAAAEKGILNDDREVQLDLKIFVYFRIWQSYKHVLS